LLRDASAVMAKNLAAAKPRGVASARVREPRHEHATQFIARPRSVVPSSRASGPRPPSPQRARRRPLPSSLSRPQNDGGAVELAGKVDELARELNDARASLREMGNALSEHLEKLAEADAAAASGEASTENEYTSRLWKQRAADAAKTRVVLTLEKKRLREEAKEETRRDAEGREKEIRALRAECDAANARRSAKETELVEYKTELRRTRDAAAAERAKHDADVAALRRDVYNAKLEVDALRNDTVVAALRAEVRELEKERDDYKAVAGAQVAETMTRGDANDALYGEVSELRSAMASAAASWKSERETIGAELARTKREAAEAAAEYARRELELTRKASDAFKDAGISGAKKAAAAAEAAAEAAARKLETPRGGILAARDASAVSDLVNARLRDSIATLTESNVSLRARVRELEDETAAARATARAAETETPTPAATAKPPSARIDRYVSPGARFEYEHLAGRIPTSEDARFCPAGVGTATIDDPNAVAKLSSTEARTPDAGVGSRGGSHLFAHAESWRSYGESTPIGTSPAAMKHREQALGKSTTAAYARAGDVGASGRDVEKINRAEAASRSVRLGAPSPLKTQEALRETCAVAAAIEGYSSDLKRCYPVTPGGGGGGGARTTKPAITDGKMLGGGGWISKSASPLARRPRGASASRRGGWVGGG